MELVTVQSEGKVHCDSVGKPSKLKKDAEETDLSQMIRKLGSASCLKLNPVVTVPPVAILPDNHNPHLEKQVVKWQLTMNTSQICRILKCNKLNANELNYIMQQEKFRLKSFAVNWTHKDNFLLSGAIMAKNGF